MMRPALVSAILLTAAAGRWPVGSPAGMDMSQRSTAVERRVPVHSAHLHTREIGDGQPIIVLHGGPDFDHSYFLPDLDRLSDAYRLIYYDQRGRGKSPRGCSLET